MRLTLDQLRATREYADLTAKQRKFVEAYAENGGDKAKAALAAYDCASERNAQILANVVVKTKKVLFCLAVYYGDESQGFADILLRAIRGGKMTMTDLRAFQLYAGIKGFTIPKPMTVEAPLPRVIDLTPRKGPLDDFPDE